MIWEDDAIASYNIALESEREREREAPTSEETTEPIGRQTTAQHRRRKWDTGGEARDSRDGARPGLTREEWECIAKMRIWGDYRRASNGTARKGMANQRLIADAGRNGRRHQSDRFGISG